MRRLLLEHIARVPHLSSIQGFDEYAAQLGGLLNRLFIPQQGNNVLISENHAQYAELRDFSSLHGSINCDHSIVIQFDEYWKKVEPRSGKLLQLKDQRASQYLLQKTFDISNERNCPPVDDPFSLFEPPLRRSKNKN